MKFDQAITIRISYAEIYNEKVSNDFPIQLIYFLNYLDGRFIGTS